MKKVRKDREIKVQDTWNNLLVKVANLPRRLTDAVEEGIQEAVTEASDFRSIRNGVLNLDLIEEDIQRIHHKLQMKRSKVLGSHLILDDQLNLVEIQTYTEKEGKTYRTVNSAEVQEIRNVSDKVLNELNQKRRVELSFTPD